MLAYHDTDTGKAAFCEGDSFPDELANCEAEREEITEDVSKYAWMRRLLYLITTSFVTINGRNLRPYRG
jgi:hypothetical protein